SLVSISPEQPDQSLSTAEKNALTFEVLSDVDQRAGRAFGLVYEFTDELKGAYRGFNLDIAARTGTPNEWALPVAATYVIDRNVTIIYAHTDPDYRDRADPREVLKRVDEKSRRGVSAACPASVGQSGRKRCRDCATSRKAKRRPTPASSSSQPSGQ